MTLQAINAALAGAVDALPLDYPVAWEGRDFTPPAGPWLAMHLLSADLEGAQTIDRTAGLLQIDIHHPLNAGAPKLLGDAHIVSAHFWPGARFSFGGQAVRIRRRDVSGIRRDDNRLTITVTISYRAVLDR